MMPQGIIFTMMHKHSLRITNQVCTGASCPPFGSVSNLCSWHGPALNAALMSYIPGLHSCIITTKGNRALRHYSSHKWLIQWTMKWRISFCHYGWHRSRNIIEEIVICHKMAWHVDWFRSTSHPLLWQAIMHAHFKEIVSRGGSGKQQCIHTNLILSISI